MNDERDAKLSAFLDGALPEADAAALRDELARSPALAERLAALGAVDEALRALPGRPLPDALRARLEERIRGGARGEPWRGDGRRAPPRRGRWLAAAALAAAAAAALVLVVWREAPREAAELARTEPAPPAGDPAEADLAVGADLPVIEVLDVLAELDELEELGSG